MKGDHMTLFHRRTFPHVFLALVLVSWMSPTAAKSLVHGQGLLWQVALQGATPSYLFGTIHATNKRVHALPPKVARALEMVLTKESRHRWSCAW